MSTERLKTQKGKLFFSAFKDTRKFDSMISFYQRDAAQTFIYVYNFICLSFKVIIVPIIYHFHMQFEEIWKHNVRYTHDTKMIQLLDT